MFAQMIWKQLQLAVCVILIIIIQQYWQQHNTQLQQLYGIIWTQTATDPEEAALIISFINRPKKKKKK